MKVTPAIDGAVPVAGIRTKVGSLQQPAPAPLPARTRDPVHVWACEIRTGTAPIVRFGTADVGSVTTAQIGLDSVTHAVTVAASDPAWRQLENHLGLPHGSDPGTVASLVQRSEEHTSELQSRGHLVCRLLL